MRGVILFIWLVLAIWVYSDCERRDAKFKWLPSIATFLVGIFALIPYLIVTRCNK